MARSLGVAGGALRKGAASVGRALQHPDVKFGQLLAAGTLSVLIFFSFLFPAPAAILVVGAVLGSVSALVAAGIVLVYRANRVINFAQGDLGALAPLLAVYLVEVRGWPFSAAFGTALVAALVLGAVVELTVIRRFARAPRLILTVATIAIALLFQAGELLLPRLFGNRSPHDRQELLTPFEFRLEWDPVVFVGSHLLAVVAVPVVGIALALFLARSRLGKAVRASAEHADRALLLGIPVRRLNTLVWVLAAGLSAIAAELRTLLVGVSVGTPLGPSLLLRALAAAVIGRMEDLRVTFAAAIALGVVEQAVFWDQGNTYVVDGVLFFVIIGALLVQSRGAVSRALASTATSWRAVAAVRPVPPELRALPLVRRARAVLGLAVATLLVAAPAFLSAGRANLLGTFLIYSIVAISLLVLTGWAGQVSLGQMAFVGFGAAVAGTLAQNGWNFFLTLLAAGLAGMAVSIVIGVPALRIRGPFLAVATFAFALAANSFFLNRTVLPWLVPEPGARIARPVLFGKFDLETEHAFYWFLLVVFAVVVVSARSLRASRTGRVVIAARDNERAAQSYGINLTRARLVAFAVSGFLAALAGALFVYQQHGLSRSAFAPEESIRVFAATVFGGLGSLTGVVLGAAWYHLVQNVLMSVGYLRLLAGGTGLLLVLLFLPGGLSQAVYGARDALVRLVARRRRVSVPSLSADATTMRPPREMPGVGRAAVAEGNGDLLAVRGLSVAYGKAGVLFDVDFRVAEGEIVALLGTNGAGKSTLLNAVCGLVPPHSGSVVFAGEDVTGVAADRIAARAMVLVPGGRGVFPGLTVGENIELAGWLHRKDRAHLAATTTEVFERFPALRDRRHELAGNLSGGEQQMLVLAQALIAKPRLLLIDELSLGLAPVVVERLLDTVRAIHKRGVTVVLVEQSVNVAASIANRALFLDKGEIRFDGRVEELLDHPELLRAVFLGGAAGDGGAGDGAAEVRDTAPFQPRCNACGHERRVVLEARGLTVSFGGVQAVTGVDLTVQEGQIVGVIGHNGAGKTTLFDLISGYLRPAAGTVVLNGEDVTATSPDVRALAGLGRSFQDARLFPTMTVAEVIAVALERHVTTRDPLAAALASPATRQSERLVAARVDELLDMLNLGSFANHFVFELSTGTRRIVELACSLAHAPDVLLLDEPSSGIAQRETEALGALLLDIRDRAGTALVVVEHDVPLVSSIADEMVALELGRVIARGHPDAVVRDPRVVASYLGSREAPRGTPGRRRDRRGVRV